MGFALGSDVRAHFFGGVLGRGHSEARGRRREKSGHLHERLHLHKSTARLAVAIARPMRPTDSPRISEAWKTPWGDINRFQRLTGDIVQPFNDAGPSIPVGFTSAVWGSLASFGARPYPGTKKWYGTSGNSFVAVVEFGEKVRARAVTAGGESGNPASPHFNDEAQRYSTGDLREVYFYKSQLQGHTEREYHPGN